MDVGRTGCNTEVVVIKVLPQPQGAHIKSIVNIFSIEGKDFEEQAVKIKKLFFKYKARSAVIDANGLKISPLYWQRYKKTLLIAGRL